MLTELRSVVARRLANGIAKYNPNVFNDASMSQIEWCVRVQKVANKKFVPSFKYSVPLQLLKAAALIPSDRPGWVEERQWLQQLDGKTPSNSSELQAEVLNGCLCYQLNDKTFSRAVLDSIIKEADQFGFESALHNFKLDRMGTARLHSYKGKMVIVEFSSPNVAKPFHAGHLRSTILGNFIANACERLSSKVLRLNFLGDWGTQFGLLGCGFAKYGSQTDLDQRPIHHLLEVYVKINKDLETDKSILEAAHRYAKRLEAGDTEALQFWKMCRDNSIREYIAMYGRLGIKFDEYHYESMYSRLSTELLESMRTSGLLQQDATSGVGYVKLEGSINETESKPVLCRSDGGALYLTRDVAAAIDRHQRYNFDHLYYVVDQSQHSHFMQLRELLAKLGHHWVPNNVGDMHIEFGRIEGMRTRRGTVTLLEDILNEARRRLAESMVNKETTKTADVERVADKLATSAIFVHDLKRRRRENYRFNWEEMVSFSGDSGVSLQYVHARLRNIELNSGVTLNVDVDVSHIQDSACLTLLQHLARFDEAILTATNEWEPAHIVSYLFMLRHLVNLAYSRLPVKGQAKDVAEARLLMFHCARQVLANGLRVLGIEPLDAM